MLPCDRLRLGVDLELDRDLDWDLLADLLAALAALSDINLAGRF